MIANLGDPTLDVAAIARAFEVSPRTLYRLFTDAGTTPMRWLWQARLVASHRALLERPNSRITDVAFACGFSELSHFSRAFKNEFGYSPRHLNERNLRVAVKRNGD